MRFLEMAHLAAGLCLIMCCIKHIHVSALSRHEELTMGNAEQFVDDYHFPMVADDIRNEAYYRALKQVVVPGVSKVLDVGAGTMLLSMMAAELGAAKVLGVEANPIMAGVAREVLRVNNFTNNTNTGHIRLFEGRFEDLKLGHKHVRCVHAFILVLLPEIVMLTDVICRRRNQQISLCRRLLIRG